MIRTTTIRSARTVVLTGALLAGVLAVAGCSSGDTATNRSGSSTASTAQASVHDDADVAFAQAMVVHHRQAIEMARLAQDRSQNPEVLDLAERIEAAQAPEIETLTGWLQDWGAEPSGSMGDGSMAHGDMGHGMGGMMSEEDMRALENATGEEFDRLFLQMMIKHHTGAVEMAGTEIADGRKPDAVELARTIQRTQNDEIAEMQQLLDQLGG
jgi:uncharacterized protein (DUF305 family)